MIYITSILDKNYISRLKTLIFSLRKYTKEYTYFVIALDNLTYETFKNEDKCIPIKIEEIHFFYPELDNIKKERDHISYIFSLSPFYPLYLLEKYSYIDHICSLDVDQFFFNSPHKIFKLLTRYSIIITPHRFSESMLKNNASQFGTYNVSFQIFKNDKIGFDCLQLWRSQCIKWCFDKLENGLYADQKYLETWFSYYGEKIHAIDHIGLGLAPWNFESYRLTRKFGKIFVDNQPLILYHYQGLKVLEYGFTYTYLDNYSKKNPNKINNLIYIPIIRSLLKFTTKIDSFNRNHRFFDFNFLIERPEYIFKRKYRIIFAFKDYLAFQKFINGFFNKFTHLFRQ